MWLLTQLVSGILSLSLLAAPMAALSASSPVSTSTTSASDTSNSHAWTAVGLGAGALALSLLSSTVKLRSFGGKITSIVPCISPLGPSLWITIQPAGVFPVSYIWTPATITKLAGPPSHIGQQVLGLADVPYACWNVVSGGLFGLFSEFSYLYGLRMTTVGTSPI